MSHKCAIDKFQLSQKSILNLAHIRKLSFLFTKSHSQIFKEIKPYFPNITSEALFSSTSQEKMQPR